jgi:hypothetical protein
MIGGGQSQGQLDASVLDRIFIGELDANSVVEETEYGAQITLSEHPHYSQHLKIARISAGQARLRDPELLAESTAHYTFDLDESPFSEILFKLFQEHETGFIVLEHEGRRRTIALSAGLPIASNSNIKSEQLGQFLLQKGIISASRAEHITAVCQRESRSLGWGLLTQARNLAQAHGLDAISCATQNLARIQLVERLRRVLPRCAGGKFKPIH